ncbi:hypothetical protein HN51_014112 [Arachis hypogaea]|uniref:mitogen-activated protein kinase kinase kinase n=1 Tax=Arachis hypogaea TaxID=3818 RepID=A0A445DMF0_ARAHY|nr:mitogen-activated protein kinase kinase kinase 1 isoform X1 [Arachis ipaensis]XP_025639643.1 mitogen-activated protein kinase kinase kinase 1 isoform X1 [Arachis hypogaea]QHO59994.1 Mitogen-activated protein kinase kinase kinase [Arachis hypogaea]RYR64383.1 hypothetical protein Ahy_A03g010495 isoform B [Arachis hypogaea]
MESIWKIRSKTSSNRKPRLERLNARKNINYNPPANPHSPPSSSSSSSSLHHQTSFRVTDGDFDLIFQSLGLSGPEDFSIPTADWEARKVRFASHTSNAAAEPKEDRNSAEVKSGVFLDSDSQLKNDNFSRPVEVGGSKFGVSSDVKVLGGKNGDGAGGGGIKGARPPLLRPIVVDAVGSNWELKRSFGLQDNFVGIGVVGDSPSSSGEIGVVGRVRNGERSMLFTDSGSFTTSHDDDSDIGGERACSSSGSGAVDGSLIEWFNRTFSSWQKGDVLGKGSFGTVYEGFTDDGFFFAVKEASLLDEGSNQGKQSVFQLRQEISLLSRFQHENIVRYFGTQEDQSSLYIFLELVPKGSLLSLYQKYSLNDSHVSAYTRQILHGLKYLHNQNVVHRDIKCANILVDVSGSVKLADFGLAKATKFNDVKSSKGSPYWMAPEVVNLKNDGYGLAADIWSLGCTVLEMLIRKPPYSDLEGMQALFRIGRGEPPPIPETLSKDARDFILECLQVNPSKRPTAAQLLEHPFLRRPFLSSYSTASPHIKTFKSL